MIDVIKEYLVDIGFSVDSQSLNRAKGSLNEAERALNKFTSSTGSKLIGAGAAVATFITTIDVAIGHMLGGLAKTDLEMQMFARMMWTSKENAMAFKNTLDAMGVSMQDLYVSPELMQKFLELRNGALTMGPPKAEYAQQMQNLREFGYEFARLKMSATYAMQWIGYYLTKYLQGPLGDLKKWFKEFNDALIKNMPVWTARVAQFASWFVRLTDTILKLPDAVKLLIVAFTGWKTTIALLSSPLTWMIAGITALLLLMEDYNTYKSGGDSLFADIWKEVEDGDTQQAFKDIDTALKSIVDSMMTIVEDVDWKNLGTDALLISIQALERSLKFISEYLKAISELMNGDLKGTMFGASNALRGAFGAELLDPDDYEIKPEFEKIFTGGDHRAAGWAHWLGDKWVDLQSGAADIFMTHGAGRIFNNNSKIDATFNITSGEPHTVADQVQRQLRAMQGGY